MMENRCVPQAVGVTVLAARMVVPDHQVSNIRNTGQATAASTTGLDSFHPTGFQILVGNAWVQGIDSSQVFYCSLPGGILTFFFVGIEVRQLWAPGMELRYQAQQPQLRNLNNMPFNNLKGETN